VLKDLSNVIASVLSRADAVTEQASALSMMPSLATARSVAQCVGMLQQHIQIALKADKAVVFLLLPDGNLALHDRGHLSDVTYPTSTYPFTLMTGAGRGAHRLKLKAMKEYSSFKEGSVMRQLASASALIFSPIRSPSASVCPAAHTWIDPLTASVRIGILTLCTSAPNNERHST
jgi:hypothetical protein